MSMTHEQYLAEERAEYARIREHIEVAENKATDEGSVAHSLIAIALLLDKIDTRLCEFDGISDVVAGLK